METLKHYYSLFSGGFDSTLATLKTISENSPLKLSLVFFNYGQKSKEREAEAVMKLLPGIKEFARNTNVNTIVDDQPRMINIQGLFSWSNSSILEGRPREGDTGLENRNLVLLSCLSSIIMADRKGIRPREYIYIITGFTNTYYDTSLEFRQAMNSFFQATHQRIEVITPLIPDDQKGEVDLDELIKIARSLNILSLLDRMTWSCYFPEKSNNCGICGPCKKRRKISGALA
jgi:7-cyano-7-deazaguanine synthase in queuosine biosynthesis